MFDSGSQNVRLSLVMRSQPDTSAPSLFFTALKFNGVDYHGVYKSKPTFTNRGITENLNIEKR